MMGHNRKTANRGEQIRRLGGRVGELDETVNHLREALDAAQHTIDALHLAAQNHHARLTALERPLWRRVADTLKLSRGGADGAQRTKTVAGGAGKKGASSDVGGIRAGAHPPVDDPSG